MFRSTQRRRPSGGIVPAWYLVKAEAKEVEGGGWSCDMSFLAGCSSSAARVRRSPVLKSPFAWDLPKAEQQRCHSCSTSRCTSPGRPRPCVLLGENSTIEGVRKVQCRAAVFVSRVEAEPSADRVARSQSQLCGVQERGHVFGHGGRWPGSHREDPDHTVEGSHGLVSLPQDQGTFDMLWAEPRRSTC